MAFNCELTKKVQLKCHWINLLLLISLISAEKAASENLVPRIAF